MPYNMIKSRSCNVDCEVLRVVVVRILSTDYVVAQIELAILVIFFVYFFPVCDNSDQNDKLI